jgi:hypothetical protein
MESLPTYAKVAQAVGITTAAFLSGTPTKYFNGLEENR